MNRVQFHSKIFLLLFVIILVSGITLAAAQETRASRHSNLEGSVHIEENKSPEFTRLLGPSGVDWFPQVKATAISADTRLLGPSGVDGLMPIKATASPVDTRLPGQSGVDRVRKIKGNWIP